MLLPVFLMQSSSLWATTNLQRRSARTLKNRTAKFVLCSMVSLSVKKFIYFFHFLSISCTYNLIEILPLGKCKEHCLTMTCTSVKKVLFGREMINLLQGSEVFASIILVEVLHMSVASFSQVNRDITTVKLFTCWYKFWPDPYCRQADWP